MSIVFDFADIKRRMDREPEAVAAVAPPAEHAADAYRFMVNSMWGWGPTKPETLDAIKRAAAQRYVSNLRAYLDATESNQIEDDGWITLWAY